MGIHFQTVPVAAVLNIVVWHHVAKVNSGGGFLGIPRWTAWPPAKIPAAYFDFRSLFLSAAYLFPQLILFVADPRVSRPGPAGQIPAAYFDSRSLFISAVYFV